MDMDPDPGLRLFGSEWLEHGYKPMVFPPEDPGPCPICGAPMITCTGDDSHGSE